MKYCPRFLCVAQRVLLWCILFSLTPRAAAQQGAVGVGALAAWRAGAQVTPQQVAAYGEARCFAAEALSDSLFARMQGRSYPAGCTVPRTQLRHVRCLHYTSGGEIRLGELVCHASISADVVTILRALYQARYPIERITLIDAYEGSDERSMQANNTSCFNFRRIAGSKRLSLHSRGLAIDINPRYNPYVKRRADGTLQVAPKGSAPYATRSATHPYMIRRGDLCYRLFRKYGFTWGGDWRHHKDYQHFERAAP